MLVRRTYPSQVDLDSRYALGNSNYTFNYKVGINATPSGNAWFQVNNLNGAAVTSADAVFNCSSSTKTAVVVKSTVGNQSAAMMEWYDAADSRRLHVDGAGNLVLQQKPIMRYRAPSTNTNYSVAVNADFFIAFTTNASGWTNTATNGTVTLPSAATAGAGAIFVVKDAAGGGATRNIAVNVSGGGTIDGAASYTINTNYGVGRFISNGSQWLTW